MQLRYWLILLAITIPVIVRSQKEGCTDPKAKNYDQEAIINDGSCVYAAKAFRPSVLIPHLPDSVMETSGLILWRGSYWTHNDSDGGNILYRLDSTDGRIIQKITLSNAVNIDWEDIDQDERFIFIGDFGNNLGSRSDKVIYLIPKDSIPLTGNSGVQTQRIRFTYGDQSDYTSKNRANDYDCEALLSFGDSLYLFTKNWASLTSRLYAIPKNSGNYSIYPLDEFDADGLITGAALDIKSRQLVLCGYKNFVPFVWILSDYRKNDFFGGNKRRIDFWELLGAQTEGITSTEEGIFIISCEKTAVNDAKLFRFDVNRID